MGSESNTDPARLQSVEELFHAALHLEPHQIGAWLDENCTGDESLRREVEALLAAHRQAGDFIENPVATFDSDLLEDVDADRLIGQNIGHYQITQRIGSGGMGAVYLARRADQQYEKQVAIKLIKRGMDTDAVIRHFRNERQILASFDHPNIARLLDGDATEDGLPYFVMEYFEGAPINEFCDERALPITQRLELFRQVCGAVSYAHRRAVIHRDIKPSNILVSADGVPKLLDFGIAKLLQPGSAAEPAATMIGLHVMTPDYASPEQVRGEAVTTASDVYSLGVVLYRLLTGRLPYRLPAQSPQDMACTIGETQPQRPSAVVEGREQLRRRLRGDLDNIVLMALRKEPERRYPSVEQFSEDIRRHLETLPVVARRDTFAYRSAKFIRRNKTATAATALVVLSLLGGIVATSWQAQRAREQEGLALAEKARAERRFNEVRQLARSVLFDYHDAIKDLAGATAVRERLVKDGLAYLDSLAGEASGDPELQRELAAAYDRVGDVRGGMYSSANLGDSAGATESYTKALRIREALTAANPGDVKNQRDLAKSYQKVGTQLMETSEAARSMEFLRNGIAVYLQLVSAQPANAEFRRELAATYNMLGLALEDWGDAAGALENQRKALELREKLVAGDPGNPTYRRGLAITHINVGRALVLSGDIKGGLEINRNALVACEALLAANPSNADYRRLLANTWQNDGDYRAILHDVDGALRSFRKKLALDEQSLADDPLNAVARGDVAYSHVRMGNLLAESKDYRQALSYYIKGLATYEEVLADSSADVNFRYPGVLTLAGIGEMKAKLGNRAGAIADSSRAIALLNGIPVNPENSRLSGARGQVYMYVAATHAGLAESKSTDLAQRREHWRKARDMYVRSLEIWQDMQRRGILTAENAEKPQEVARAIAWCDESLRKLSSATAG